MAGRQTPSGGSVSEDGGMHLPIPMTPQRGDHQDGQFGGGHGSKVPNVRIRTFYGDPRKYLEWKREVAATQTLYQVKEEQMAGLLYLALSPGEGRPRDLMSHMAIEDICTEEGLKWMLQILDKEYKKESHVQADDAQEKYERCRRTPYQPMNEFLRALRLSKRILERDDPGTTISDVSFARKMLSKSGLSVIERRGVLSAAGAEWNTPKIEEALRMMYSDAHKDDRRRVGEMRGSKKSTGKGGSRGFKGRGKGQIKSFFRRGKGKGTYYEGDPEEDLEEGDELDSDEGTFEEDDDEATEGTATYHHTTLEEE